MNYNVSLMEQLLRFFSQREKFFRTGRTVENLVMMVILLELISAELTAAACGSVIGLEMNITSMIFPGPSFLNTRMRILVKSAILSNQLYSSPLPQQFQKT